MRTQFDAGERALRQELESRRTQDAVQLEKDAIERAEKKLALGLAGLKDQVTRMLYRYLSGVEFRQRVEAVVDAFSTMRADLDQERRAAERQWARRAKQLEAVTCNLAGMYGDLQGLVPTLPPIALLELPGGDGVGNKGADAESYVRIQ